MWLRYLICTCKMTDLYDAAEMGDLEQVTLLLQQGTDINQVGGDYEGRTALSAAADKNHLAVVQHLVEQGADMEIGDSYGSNPIIYASTYGHLEVVRYLLEQGADRDKASNYGITSLHEAARRGHLEIAKLLMVYGANLNAKTDQGNLPIDLAEGNEEIKKAIRDEPRRRMDHGYKRATEENQQLSTEEEELDNKQPVEEGKKEDEDQDSELSSDEEND